MESSLDRIHVRIDAFESEWRSGRRPSISEFLNAAAAADRARLRSELVALELEYRLRAGEPASVEDYLAAYPEFQAEPETVLDLIVLEFQVRSDCAQRVTVAQVLDRFPAYREVLAARLAPMADSPPEIPGYDIQSELGRGGMGVVYRAIDVEFGRPVAIKLVRSAGADHAETVERFREEARITGRLQHPGVPPVHRMGTLSNGQPFLAMKLIEGRTLAELFSKRADASTELPRYLQVFETLCQTVAYAHEQGVIHRDLKPSNVMVGAFGEVQVMDWGLARLRGRKTKEPTLVPTKSVAVGTRTGAVLGTPAYMPPEQARGEQGLVDAPSDVFSLGAMLCEILTGKPPYSGAADVLVAARDAQLERAHERLATCGVEADLIGLAKRCLTTDPAARPEDASTLAQAVAAHREGVELRLRESERDRAATLAKAAEADKRRRAQRRLSAAVLLLLLGGVAFVWFADRLSTRRRVELAERETLARAAILTDLEQADRLLKTDRADEAHVALERAGRRLQEDPQADLAGRLADLRRQSALLAQLDRIRDLMFTAGEATVVLPAVRQDYRRVFLEHGLDPAHPVEFLEQVDGWAIREQIIGGLDLWLRLEARLPGLPETLALLDSDVMRNAWRVAVAAGTEYPAQVITDSLASEYQTPRFVAAYAQLLPRASGTRLLRATWDRHPDSLPLALSLANFLYQGDADQKVEAEGYYRVCLGLHPGHTGSLASLGVLLLDKGDVIGALDHFRRAVALAPGDAKYMTNLGGALYAQGETAEAIEWLQKAIIADPDNAGAHNNLGNALSGKDVDRAIASYGKAISINPNLVQAYYNLGLALTGKGDVEKARECYYRVLDLAPKHAKAYYSLGVLYDPQTDPVAIELYRKAIKYAPKFAMAHYRLGLALANKGKASEAIASFREAIVHDSALVHAHYNLGVALAKCGETKKAILSFEAAIALAPQSAETHFSLGLACQTDGDKKRAFECYETAIKHDPRHAGAHNNLGILQLERNDTKGAFSSFRVAADLEPNNVEYQFNFALALVNSGDKKEAIPRFRKVIEIDAKDAAANSYLALCLWDEGRFAEAVPAFEQAFRIEPRLPDDLAYGSRLKAARAATLASNGEGTDPPAIAARPAFRKKALDWLRADLTAWQKTLNAGPANLRQRASATLSGWMNDIQLASVRDAEALAKLSSNERKAWQQLWTDVRSALEVVDKRNLK